MRLAWSNVTKRELWKWSRRSHRGRDTAADRLTGARVLDATMDAECYLP